jgi:hypothetical protein
MSYKIVLHYADLKLGKRTVERGLTLEEAQAYCRDPESSSHTCTSATGRRRTKQRGHWFYGYTKE